MTRYGTKTCYGLSVTVVTVVTVLLQCYSIRTYNGILIHTGTYVQPGKCSSCYCYTYQTVSTMLSVIRASLSELHICSKFGTVITYVYNKLRQKVNITLFGWYGCRIYKQLQEKANDSLVRLFRHGE